MSKRIALIGAPGSGKSVLASNVYTALKARGLNAELIPEWIRYDIQRSGPMETIWEQYRTRALQQELEDSVPQAVEWVICDSGTLTPYFYAALYANHADARQRIVLQDMFRYLMDDLYQRRYDLILFLERVPGVDVEDGTRYQKGDEIDVLERMMDLYFMRVHRVGNAHRISGAFEKRLDHALSLIGGLS